MRIKKLHIENYPLLILYLGAVSTAGGGIWLWLQTRILEATRPLFCVSVLRAGLKELLLSAVLHLLLAVALAWDRKTRNAA